MLTFEATPARVREATKLAYRMGVSMQGVQAFWDAQPRETNIPGFAFTLKPYQADGVAHLERWDGNVLIADEPGTGKTCQVMAYAFKNRRFPMCVIMPKTLLLNWRREITLMLGSQLKVLVVGFVPGKSREQVLKAQYPHVSYSKTPLPGYDVTLINYDIVARNQDTLERVGYDYVVCDESHKVKNPKAHRTQAIQRLVTGRELIKGKRDEWRVLHKGVKSVTFMTGTPILSRPSELWTTVSMIADWVPQFRNFFKFASRYCNAHKTRFGWDFSGHSNEAELNQLLNDTIMIRRRKADVMKELPAKTFVTVPLEFDRREYDAVAHAFEGSGDWRAGMDTLIKHGGRPARSNEAIVAINKCREIAGLAKMQSAIEWILDYVEEGAKLVVFAHHQKMVDDITGAVKAAGVGVRMIRGGVGLEERAQAAQDFQTDPNVKVIVLNIASAGFGITLTAASACAFCQLPWTPSDVVQASDRVHRIGQRDNVTVYNLVAADTVEETISDMIMAKAVVANAVIDGGENQELAEMNLGK
jgi:SWI/SNF-related matrix-associated actin-dependent regulator of chromatin subfamily A-like protein 1